MSAFFTDGCIELAGGVVTKCPGASAVLLLPVVLNVRACNPVAVLKLPVVWLGEHHPGAVLLLAVVLLKSALVPVAVWLLPVVFF